MIVGAAVCPGAPLLVPGLAPSLASSVPELVKSCLAAVESLRTADRIVLLTSGPRSRDLGSAAANPTVVHPPGTPVTSRLLTGRWTAPDFEGRLTPDTDSPTPAGGPAPGVGVIVGAALLDAVDLRCPATGVELGDAPDSGADPLELFRSLLDGPYRVGLLVMAEGSASRGSDSPGGGHDGAEAYDGELALALASGAPDRLQQAVAAGVSSSDVLVSTGGPALAALASLCVGRPPKSAALLYEGAPFGVGYFVATWSWQ